MRKAARGALAARTRDSRDGRLHMSEKQPRWRRAAKKLVCAASSAMLAAALVPATAFAAVDGDNVYYTLPSANSAVSLQHAAKGNNGSDYTYQYLSAAYTPATGGWFESYYYIMGINGVNSDRALRSIKATDVNNGVLTSSINNAIIGLFGTNVNSNPDEYMYNSCVALNGGTVADDQKVWVNIYAAGGNKYNRSDASVYVIDVTVDGVEYSMPMPIYMETTLINSGTGSNSYSFPDGSGSTITAASGSEARIAQWVDIENKRSNRPKTGTYNPMIINYSVVNGGTGTITKSMYAIAEAADKAIEASKDANGNYTLQNRYVEGANTYKIAQDFEDISKAVQYYLISKFDSGKLTKKVAGVVCGYDPDTKHYAVRVLDTKGVPITGGSEKDPETNYYGGRYANNIMAIADDVTTKGLTEAQAPYSEQERNFVKWYTAEDLIATADALFIDEAPSTNTISNYLANASDGKAYTVYAASTGDEANIQGLLDAQAAAQDAKKHAADICYKWPDHANTAYYAQGCENSLVTSVAAAFMYPSELNITDTMGWFAKRIWHIADGSVQEVVDTTCHNISLARNQVQLGALSSDYESKIDAILNAGNWYYINNASAIDSINSGNIATYDLAALKARTTDPGAKTDPVVAKKQNQTVKITTASQTIKAKKVKSKKQTFSVKAKAKTAVTFKKVSADKPLSISKAGKVTVKKGTKKGTYKIKVKATAKATSAYNSASATKIIKVKVK